MAMLSQGDFVESQGAFVECYLCGRSMARRGLISLGWIALAAAGAEWICPVCHHDSESDDGRPHGNIVWDDWSSDATTLEWGYTPKKKTAKAKQGKANKANKGKANKATTHSSDKKGKKVKGKKTPVKNNKKANRRLKWEIHARPTVHICIKRDTYVAWQLKQKWASPKLLR